MAKRSSHVTRILIEGMSNFSPYSGARLAYARLEYDPIPMINIDRVTHMDITRAIKVLWERKELSKQELMMLQYVASDGRLSRRDISFMIERDEGMYIDQRTISRRLESAYGKLSKFLGHEYSDTRVFKMIARRRGYPPPYILSDKEIEEVQTIWERV